MIEILKLRNNEIIRLIYKPYTDKGDKILDFSICGYKRSEEPIPDVPVVATVNPLQGETTADGTMAYPEETVTPESMFMQQLIDRIGNDRAAEVMNLD